MLQLAQLPQLTDLAPRTVLLLVVAALCLLALSVLLRSRSGGKYELKPGDLP